MKLNIKNFINYLNSNFIFENKPFIAVAVSGGPDSMALLFLMKKWVDLKKGNLVALIVNHKIRKEATHEAKQVEQILKNKNINSKILSVQKSQVLKRSMKEARTNRFRLLTNYCNKNHILHLFVAHHNDDYIETYINRKLIGSDIEGLNPINEISLNNKICIIRPLLNFSKIDIYKFNKDNKISYLEDPTNLSTKYTRTVIRNFLKNIDKKSFSEIKNEIKLIKKNLPFYVQMIFEIIIKNSVVIDHKILKFDIAVINELDDILAEKIIKKIYGFIFSNQTNIRSAKIQILIKNLKKSDFKIFNLKSMIIKKTDQFVIFSQKMS